MEAALLQPSGSALPIQAKKTRAERNRDVMRARQILVDRFPLAFMPKGAEKKPLKVGIEKDIFSAEIGVSNNLIRKALSNYTGGPTYLRNVKSGAPRINLDGTECGTVADAHEAHATSILARRGLAS